jgi:PAS domain S-box-containing protein
MSKPQKLQKGSADFIVGDGEMSRRTRELDWSRTPIGPIERWPQGLKTAVQIMLGSRYAMWLGWGPEFTFLYNDAYAKMTLGPKHPWALGMPTREVWHEIWNDVGPRATSVLETGQATWDESLLLFLERDGFPEETYHTFSYSPLPADDGSVGGMLCVVTEDTERTIGERRLRTLREFAARTIEEVKSAKEACQNAAFTLENNPQDVPFALVYLLDSDGRHARLTAMVGVTKDMPTSPDVVDITSENSVWPFQQVVNTGKGILVEDLVQRFGELPLGIWSDPPQKAKVLPLAKPGQTQLAGFLVAGVSPRLHYDDKYRGFFELLASQIVTAVANARAYDEERKRAEALAELDRAKTTFFSNVSHEFRTPLTLMLGPVEDMLSRSYTELSPAAKGQLEVVNRNGFRLLRLVNSLLDFSRIEAGRVRAAFQKTELAAYTAELASVFRAAVERAGLVLDVDCPPISQSAYVDRDMWEKIVLNLLSNAFKFTFEGSISVSLQQRANTYELTVRDTGTGIPSEHLPRLFERFHRIENAQGRTHEGSGIGLALVHEMVKLHSGSVTVQSKMGEGTTFTVTIPTGKDHLPSEQIGDSRSLASTATGATPYVEEAMRWLPVDSSDESERTDEHIFVEQSQTAASTLSLSEQDDDRPYVIVADDNADMRQYVARLLSEHYRVTAVADGEAALAEVRKQQPNMVLTDVMMPRLDGFGLLDVLRSDPKTADLPVIMLSARAGEESRVEGMEAGADDYLVKPFSARELLARVGSHLQMAKMRIESAESLRQSEERLRMALSAARMVAWHWIPHEDMVIFSENVGEVLGLQAGSTIGSSDVGFSLIHPEDVDRHRAKVLNAIEQGGSYLSNYRIIRQDNGELIWLEERGNAVSDRSGMTQQLVGVVMDITDRKRAETALREREQFLRAIFDTTPECIKLVAPDGTLLQMNAAGLKMVGAKTLSSVAGSCVYEIIAPEYRSAFQEFNERICAGENGVLEFDIVGLGGTRRNMETHAVPLEQSDGTLVQLALTRDVTDRKKAEQALRRERDLLHVTLASIGDAVITTNTERRITNMNRVAETLTGWTLQEASGHLLEEVFQIVNEETRKPAENPAKRALRDGVVVGLANHTILIQKDGGEIPIDDSAAPIRGESDSLVGCVLVFRDITERKRAELALRKSESYFRSMADNAPVMLWVTDSNGACTFLSRGWYEYTGQTEQEGLGDNGFGWLQAVHPDDREPSSRVLQDATTKRESFSFDYRLLTANGEYRWAIDAGRPRFDESGEFLGFIGSVFDVHQRKQADQFRACQARVLEMITSEMPLKDILTELVTFIESQIPDAMGSIQLLDERGERLCHGAAPRLPEEYNQAIDGIEIGPNVGSCGTAAFRGERVIVEDIQSDQLWENFKELAAKNGLAACWSQPILSSTGEHLGTAAVYFPTTRPADPLELDALESTSRFAGIAIERPRAQTALRESEKRFRALTKATFDVIYRMNADWTEMKQLDGQEFIIDTIEPRHSWLETYIPEEDRSRVLHKIKNVIESKTVFELEHRVMRVDGSVGWTYSRAIPVLGEDGEIIEWFGAASDVTARRDAEENLRKSHEEFARFNRVAVDRELRMIQLKKDINELCERLDQPKRFPLLFDIHSESSKG